VPDLSNLAQIDLAVAFEYLVLMGRFVANLVSSSPSSQVNQRLWAQEILDLNKVAY
jgi:hypothetical protein